MAKPYPKRPAPKPKRPLWPILVIFGALTLVVTGVIALTRQPAMQPAGVTLIASPGPRVAVDRQKVDFGQVKMDTPVTAAFKVKNVGSQPLQILGQPQVRVVEGCWPPRTVVGSTTLKPGQETELSMTFTMHAGMDGPHDFRVDLKTNDPVEPIKELVVLSDWIE